MLTYTRMCAESEDIVLEKRADGKYCLVDQFVDPDDIGMLPYGSLRNKLYYCRYMYVIVVDGLCNSHLSCMHMTYA